MKYTGTLGGDLRGNLPSPSVIALTDAPGNRKPIKLLTEGKYLKVEDGFIVCDNGGTGDHKVSANQLDEDGNHADYLEFKITGDGSTTTSEIANGTNGKKVVIHAAGDHKVAIDSADNTQGSAGYLYNKISSPNGTISRSNTGGATPTLGLDVFCSRQTPKPSVAGGNPGTSGAQPSSWDHQHPLESPTVTGSFLYPSKRVSYGSSTVEQLPVISYPTQESVTVTYTDLSVHSSTLVYTIGSLGTDSRYFLTGFTATINQEFTGSGLTHLYLLTDVNRNYIYNSVQYYDGVEYLTPTEAAVYSSYPKGFDLIGMPATTEYTASPNLSVQFVPIGATTQTIRWSVESNGCLLDQLTAGSITFTLFYELREPANVETITSDMLKGAPGSNEGSSKYITTVSPFTPNSGLILNSLRLIIGNRWTVPDNVAGNITVKCETASGQTIFSPIDIRNQYADVTFDFTGLLTPFNHELMLTFERNSGTISDINGGSFRLEYGVTQFTTPDPTVLGYNALTASQVADNTTIPFSFEQEINAAGEVLVGEVYATLNGTPGLASIPATEHRFGILGALDHIDAGVQNKWRIKCAVWRDGQGSPDSPYLIANGPNMFNTALSVAEIAGTPSGVTLLSIADRLVFSIYAVTNSNSGFTFTFAQDANLASWFELPFSMGSFGTLDHQELTPISRGFSGASSESVTYRHPQASIAPGWLHTPFGDVIVVDGGGILTISSLERHPNVVLVSGSSMNGIDASDMQVGDRLQVRFSTNCHVYGGQAVSAPAKPFVFPTVGGLSGESVDIITGPYGSAEFQLFSDGFYLVSPPYITDQI